jgi:methyl-accepting chemotaxis protein
MIAVQQAHTAILQQYKDRERTLKVVVPFRRAGAAFIGCVSVSSSLQQADNALAVHRRIDLFLIPASVLFLVLMLHFLFTRGLTGRIGKLGLAMIHARGGALDKRAPVERQDELGVIAQLFNETMEEIERASRERDRLLEEQKDFNTQSALHASKNSMSSSRTCACATSTDCRCYAPSKHSGRKPFSLS